MKFFRKGISTIVLSSKLLLALGVGLPFCSFQKIYAGPQKELLELSKKAGLTVRDINSAINNLEQDRTPGSQSSYIKILKNLNINSTNPEMVDAIKRAFQKAADLINRTFSKSVPGKSQSLYQNKDFIFNTLEQINRGATSRTTSSKPTIKPVQTSKITSSTNPQPTVDADLEKVLQDSIKTAKEDDERRAKALEAQLAKQKLLQEENDRKLAKEKFEKEQAEQKAIEDQLRLQQEQIRQQALLAEQQRQAALAEKQKQEKEAEEKAAQTTSTSSALTTAAKVVGATAGAVGVGLIAKAIYDKATAPSTVATPAPTATTTAATNTNGAKEEQKEEDKAPSFSVDCTQFFNNRDTNVSNPSSSSSDTTKAADADKKNVIEVVENTPASSSPSSSSAQIDELSKTNEKLAQINKENDELEKEVADAEAAGDDDVFFDVKNDNADTSFHPGNMDLSGVSTMFEKAEREAEAMAHQSVRIKLVSFLKNGLLPATVISGIAYAIMAYYFGFPGQEAITTIVALAKEIGTNPNLLLQVIKQDGLALLVFIKNIPGAITSQLNSLVNTIIGFARSKMMPSLHAAAPTCPMLPNGVNVQDVCNSPYSQLPGQYGIDCPATTATTSSATTLAPAVSAPTAVAQASTPWYCGIRSVTDKIFSLGGLFPVNNNCH